MRVYIGCQKGTHAEAGVLVVSITSFTVKNKRTSFETRCTRCIYVVNETVVHTRKTIAVQQIRGRMNGVH
jgi:hypothetical protein